MRATYSSPATLAVALTCALTPFLLHPAAATPAPAPKPLTVSINIDLGGELANLTARPVCDQYSFVANYSAIGANATMRDALRDASPQGADVATRVVGAAMEVADRFRLDRAVNRLCGNLSALADQEAARNFSRGIVADQTVGGGGGLGTGARASLGSLVFLTGLSLLVSGLVLVV